LQGSFGYGQWWFFEENWKAKPFASGGGLVINVKVNVILLIIHE
jgi:hypothetical protein